MATRTIDTPAAPIARMIGASKSRRPLRAMATVRPENSTVRPAVATVRAVAATTSSRVKLCRRRSVSASPIRPSSSRYRLTVSSP